ncbi:class I SAM-dependent methyltransferase [Streptomyces sp. IB2014 016-6]|nr:class I SAM-dependent methyltransferase [Streptomyces sp. IB2014 016-6]
MAEHTQQFVRQQASTQVAEPGNMPSPRTLTDVPGWFTFLDQALFDWFLIRQGQRAERGDLLEMGVYVGKSAIFLGRYLQQGESLTVCDLFESPAPDDANSAEIARYLPLATRQAFECNYLSFHDELPQVLQAPTSVVVDEVPTGSCRFVHIDASHLYEHVSMDIATARSVLLPSGVVVLDDFRSEHTPGVALAAWEAVLAQGLNPVCLSKDKFYGTWDDPKPIQDDLLAMLSSRQDLGFDTEWAAGRRIVRVHSTNSEAASS